VNLFNYEIPPFNEEFKTILEYKNIKIVRIVSSDILEVVEYCQSEDEWVVLLKGEAKVELNGVIKLLKSGDILFIEAHTPHKVLATSKGALWLAIHIY